MQSEVLPSNKLKRPLPNRAKFKLHTRQKSSTDVRRSFFGVLDRSAIRNFVLWQAKKAARSIKFFPHQSIFKHCALLYVRMPAVWFGEICDPKLAWKGGWQLPRPEVIFSLSLGASPLVYAAWPRNFPQTKRKNNLWHPGYRWTRTKQTSCSCLTAGWGRTSKSWEQKVRATVPPPSENSPISTAVRNMGRLGKEEKSSIQRPVLWLYRYHRTWKVKRSRVF